MEIDRLLEELTRRLGGPARPPPEPCIKDEQKQKITALSNKLLYREQLGQRATRCHIIFCLSSAALFLTSATLMRVGLRADRMRLINYSAYAMGTGIVVLTVSTLFQRWAAGSVASLSDDIKKELRQGLGSKKKPPRADADCAVITELYQYRAQLPWMLRYRHTVNDQVEQEMRAILPHLSRAKRVKQASLRQAKGMGAIGLAAMTWVAVSLVTAKGARFSLSYGVATMMAAFSGLCLFKGRHALAKAEVQRMRGLVDETVRHRPALCEDDQIQPALTCLIKVDMNACDLARYPDLKKVQVQSWLADQALPPKLKKVKIKGTLTAITELPHSVRKLQVDGYCPRVTEDLKKYSDLKKVSVKQLGGAACDSLESLPRLHHFRGDNLTKLTHPMLKKVTRLTLDHMPPLPEDPGPVKRAIFAKQLTLRRPTTHCLDWLEHLKIIQNVTLEKDPGISFEQLTSLFDHSEVRRLEIKKWQNGGGMRTDQLQEHYMRYKFFIDGDELDKDKMNQLMEKQNKVRFQYC